MTWMTTWQYSLEVGLGVVLRVGSSKKPDSTLNTRLENRFAKKVKNGDKAYFNGFLNLIRRGFAFVLELVDMSGTWDPM